MASLNNQLEKKTEANKTKHFLHHKVMHQEKLK
jgi:hypothetical protein